MPQKIPHSTYLKHIKIKAWNEYTIEYYGLRIDKKQDSDYLRIEIYLGRLMIYQKVNNQSGASTPYEMHQELHGFLMKFISAVQPFGITYKDANFKPPDIT